MDTICSLSWWMLPWSVECPRKINPARERSRDPPSTLRKYHLDTARMKRGMRESRCWAWRLLWIFNENSYAAWTCTVLHHPRVDSSIWRVRSRCRCTDVGSLGDDTRKSNVDLSGPHRSWSRNFAPWTNTHSQETQRRNSPIPRLPDWRWNKELRLALGALCPLDSDGYECTPFTGVRRVFA